MYYFYLDHFNLHGVFIRRPDDEAATPDNGAGRDKEGVLSLGMALRE